MNKILSGKIFKNILFFFEFLSAERCDLRFGSKRTENFSKRTEKLKSHETLPQSLAFSHPTSGAEDLK